MPKHASPPASNSPVTADVQRIKAETADFLERASRERLDTFNEFTDRLHACLEAIEQWTADTLAASERERLEQFSKDASARFEEARQRSRDLRHSLDSFRDHLQTICDAGRAERASQRPHWWGRQ